MTLRKEITTPVAEGCAFRSALGEHATGIPNSGRDGLRRAGERGRGASEPNGPPHALAIMMVGPDVRENDVGKRGLATAVVAIVVGTVATVPAIALAQAQTSEPEPRVGKHWLSRLDVGVQMPKDLALRFARAAVATGLTRTQAAQMLNDDRFAAAVGSPDQGFGMLEAIIRDPEKLQQAYELLADAHLTASGADSLQNSLMSVVPELRNAYLEDLGLVAVEGPAGILVLVDIETGRQYLGEDLLGAQLRTPGGGPLPSPSAPPDPGGTITSLIPPSPAPAQDGNVGGVTSRPSEPGGLWELPPEDSKRPLFSSPFIYLGAGLFLMAWVGYAVLAIARRLHPR